jgi:hypothetical protein
MQVEPVVMPVPHRTWLVALFQDETGDTGMLEASPNSQPGRPRTDDNRMTGNGIKSWDRLGMREFSRHPSLRLDEHPLAAVRWLRSLVAAPPSSIQELWSVDPEDDLANPRKSATALVVKCRVWPGEFSGTNPNNN